MDFQIGTVKKTQGQVKKHATQCNTKELDQLENALSRVQDLWLKRGIKTGFHLQDKIRNGETEFSYKRAMETMLNPVIVEYNEKSPFFFPSSTCTATVARWKGRSPTSPIRRANSCLRMRKGWALKMNAAPSGSRARTDPSWSSSSRGYWHDASFPGKIW